MTDEPADTQTLPLAAIWQRAVARFIDGLLFSAPLIAWLLAQPAPPEGQTIDVPLLLRVGLPLMSAIYEITMVTLRGQTLGKMALGIRVVRTADGDIPVVQQSAIRYMLPTSIAFLPIAFAPILSLLVYLSAIWDPGRRGYHDKAAGTRVVLARRGMRPAAAAGSESSSGDADPPVT